jgi:hypothetical protein
MLPQHHSTGKAPLHRDHLLELSRREQQVMDLHFGRGRASAAEVQAGIPDAPGYVMRACCLTS